jgi:hypothetical protein
MSSAPDLDLEFVTLAERPELLQHVNSFPDDNVAEFLYHDAVSTALFVELIERHPEFTIMALERTTETATATPVAMTCTMPFTGTDEALPPGGYDAVLLSAAADTLSGRRGMMVAALFAVVQPALRGRGISPRLLAAARDNSARLGYTVLVVPARPTRKHEHPHVPMHEYVTWTRPDGLPVDPWLRVHVRAGGEIVGVASHSMRITGTLDEWRRWTGLPFADSGPVYVPGGLVAVQCDPVADVATYIEPNVWVRHHLDSPRE